MVVIKILLCYVLTVPFQSVSASPIAPQFSVYPDSYVAAVRDEAAFSCTTEAVMMVDHIEWSLNETSLNDSLHSNVTAFVEPVSNTGILKFTNLSLVYNNTRIKCSATINSDTKVSSSTSLLLIQGKVNAVEHLKVTKNGNDIFLHWTAPFMLTSIFFDSTITYCLDVQNSTTTVHSQCEINATEFSYHLPFESWCELNLSVTPVNMAGNGTRKSVNLLLNQFCGGQNITDEGYPDDGYSIIIAAAALGGVMAIVIVVVIVVIVQIKRTPSLKKWRSIIVLCEGHRGGRECQLKTKRRGKVENGLQQKNPRHQYQMLHEAQCNDADTP